MPTLGIYQEQACAQQVAGRNLWPCLDVVSTGLVLVPRKRAFLKQQSARRDRIPPLIFNNPKSKI
jgi:hypothetical protein